MRRLADVDAIALKITLTANPNLNLNANLNDNDNHNHNHNHNPNLAKTRIAASGFPGAAIGLFQTAAMQDVTPKVVRIAVRMATIV